MCEIDPKEMLTYLYLERHELDDLIYDLENEIYPINKITCQEANNVNPRETTP